MDDLPPPYTPPMHSLPTATISPPPSASLRRNRPRSGSSATGGIDRVMLEKMSSLEAMVARMQNAMDSQYFAIEDVQDQLREINGSIGHMHVGAGGLEDGEQVQFVLKADVRPVLDNSLLPPSPDGAAMAGFDIKRTRSPRIVPIKPSSLTSLPSRKSSVSASADPATVAADSEQDDDYLRLCKILNELLSDAKAAVNYPSNVAPDSNSVAHSRNTSYATTYSHAASESLPPRSCSPLSSSDPDAERRQRILASPALVPHPDHVDDVIVTDPDQLLESVRLGSTVDAMLEDARADQQLWQAVTHTQDSSSFPEHVLSSPLSISGSVMYEDEWHDALTRVADDQRWGLPDPNVNQGRAVEVRFYCQIIRPGSSGEVASDERHELRRKLIIPYLGSSSMASISGGMLRRLLTGILPTSDDSDFSGDHSRNASQELIAGISGEVTDPDTLNTALTRVSHDQLTRAKSTPSSGVTNVVEKAFGTAQIFYWIILMLVGVALMDAWLCRLAGEQMAKTVEGLNGEGTDEMERRRKQKAIQDGASRVESIRSLQHREVRRLTGNLTDRSGAPGRRRRRPLPPSMLSSESKDEEAALPVASSRERRVSF